MENGGKLKGFISIENPRRSFTRSVTRFKNYRMGGDMGFFLMGDFNKR